MSTSTFKFCPKCGGNLKETMEGHHPRLQCSNCGFIFYQNSKPTSSAFIIENDKVLLAKRAVEPSKGKWDIPGGFLELGEHPKEGMRREVKEETGLEVEILDILDFVMDTYGEDVSTLNICYVAKIKSGEPQPADDVAELKWFKISELPTDLAFKNTPKFLNQLKDWASKDFSGQLKKIDPERLINDSTRDEVSDFFLTMGLFYNDLKSLTYYLFEINNAFSETPDVPSPSRGEYGGMKSHLERLTASTLYEFFEFLDNNKNVLQRSEFFIIYDNLNQELQRRWDLLVNIATGDKTTKERGFAKVLSLIRHNLTFHYYQSSKVLRKGFVDNFLKDSKHPGNEWAYYSIDAIMKNTRFYYCDAASQRAMINQVVGEISYPEYARMLRIAVEDVNFTIMALMKEFLNIRPF